MTPKFPEKPKIRQSGKNIIFEVQLICDPQAEISWSKGALKIVNGGRYKVTSTLKKPTEYLVALEIVGVIGSDGGEYKVYAKNVNGEANATINLNIGNPAKK